MAKIVITDKCINCGVCAGTCPVEAIKEGRTQHVINENCILCGNCIGVCPVEAIIEVKGK